MTRILIPVFISMLFVFNIKSISAQTFIERTVSTSYDAGREVITIDIDHDGDMDFVTSSDFRITVWKNDGNQNFTSNHIYNPVVTGEFNIHVADVNGDGELDVVATNFPADEIFWLENNGAENFTKHTVTADFNGAMRAFSIDLDQDGDMDIVATAYLDDQLAWWENDGDENFTKENIGINYDGANGLFVVDFDGDGDLDILTTATEANDINWWENNGGPSIFLPHNIHANVNSAWSITAADMNGDGNLDAITTATSANDIDYWVYVADNNFTRINVDVAMQSTRHVQAGDLDGDGDMDLVASAFDGHEIAWYQNPGDEPGGVFSKISIKTDFIGASGVSIADISGDGNMDFVGISYDNDLLWWERQQLNMTVENAEGTVIDNGDEAASSSQGTFFGNVALGSTLSKTFTIRSTDEGTLLLTGAPHVVLSGTGAAAFSVTAQPNSLIEGYSTTTFTVTFEPESGECGQQSAYVTIYNNTTDNNPYTFRIAGNGVDGVESCSVTYNDGNAGGIVYTVNYSGSYEDFIIPADVTADRLELVLKGADGGRNGSCDEPGGKGAEVKAVFSVGTGTNDLRPGGTLRFIVGQKGESRNGSSSGGAGGGGGTGILYKKPGATTDNIPSVNMSDANTDWIILAVAGGGGGAYGRLNLLQDCANGKPGSGGNTGTSGTSGGGSNDGGVDGDGGESHDSKEGGGGGGYLSDGDDAIDKGGKKGVITGGLGGLHGSGPSNRYGGFGYGGGGAACGGALDSDWNCGGGGGGGFSGGGGGNAGNTNNANNGGGGGSFVNNAAISSFTAITGNQTIFAGDHGYLKYAFRTSTGPVARCKDLNLTIGGSHTIQASLVNLGSTVEPFQDFAAIGFGTNPALSLPTSVTLNCSHIGEIQRTLMVKSTSGAYSTCITTITVSDNVAPVVNCTTTPVTLEVGLDNTTQLAVSAIEVGAGSDACGFITNKYLSKSTFTCADIGTQVVTLFAEDNSGNIGLCSATVNVVETTETPVVICPPNLSVSTNTNDCTALVTEGLAPASLTGPCSSGLSYQIDFAPPVAGILSSYEFPTGVSTVTYALAHNSASAECSFTVTATIEEVSCACYSGNVIYVKKNATGANTGADWTNAFNHLQDALDLAASCPAINQIWVAAGTYYPDEGAGQTNNATNSSFQMIDDVAIYGGFNGTETSVSQRNWVVNSTILSGDLMQNDGANFTNNSDNAIHVVLNSNLGATAQLDGFTIRAGYSRGSDVVVSSGAGMTNISASPTLANCIFTNNIAQNGGGGMINWNSDPSLTNCSFTGNNATNAGGMYNHESAPVLVSCHFSGNSAGSRGGGMYNNFSDPVLTNCIFTGNKAPTSGGMYNWDASPSLLHCSFSGNSATVGGAMRNLTASFPMVANCIFWGNSTGISDESGSSTTIQYTIIQGGHDGEGNLDADPLFTLQPAHASAPTSVGDLRLQACSPAIDAGLAAIAPDTDFDGNPRPANAGFDMGAFEYQGTLPVVLCYADNDGDGYGNPAITQQFCMVCPTGYASNSADCDDNDALEKPGQVWYKDTDSDGHSNGATLSQCQRPTGYKIAAELTTTTGDCNDNNADEFPGQTWFIDADGDNYGGASMITCGRPNNGFLPAELSGNGTDDCNDNNADEFPGQTWYIDADGDHHGGAVWITCGRPDDGFLLAELNGNGTDDCNDNSADEFPGQTWYIDADGDHYGSASVSACLRPVNGFLLAELNGNGVDDCNPNDGDEFPGQTWYIDADGDSYGSTSLSACLRPVDGFLLEELNGNGTDDCNDNSADEFPGQTWYIDADGDHYGSASVSACLRPVNGFLLSELNGNGTDDCNDNNAEEFPGQIWYIDGDGDHYGRTSVSACLRPADGFLLAELNGNGTDDCNDNLAGVNPGATEICNGLDDTCDGQIDENEVCCPTGSIVYVNKNAVGANNGSSWANAFTSLQDALKLAPTCSAVTQIWVAAGTYYSDEGIGQTNDTRNSTFRMVDGVAIYGGFAGTEAELSQRNWVANVTVLSGDINQDGDFFGNSYQVVYNHLPLSPSAVLDGFTVTMGSAFPPGLRNGGGMYNSPGSNPTVRNCIFSENQASLQGGGMHNHVAAPTISNCVFFGNIAQNGGGIHNVSASPTISGCTFQGNMATNGSGIYNNASSGTSLTNCVLSGNIAFGNGGGVFNLLSSPTITNCTFSGNNGGAVFNNNNSNLNLKNCLIWNNQFAGNTGAAESSLVNISSTPVITHSLIQNHNPSGAGNLNGIPNADDSNYPGFITPINPADAPLTGGDFRLTVCSPAIDAGTSDGAPNEDLDGNPRPYNGGITDMGAYEYQGAPPALMASCKNVILPLDGTGHAVLAAMQVDNGSFSTCGIASVELSKTDFDCDDIGEQVVTLTVTDVQGNSSACTALITVLEGHGLPTGWGATDVGITANGSSQYAPCTNEDLFTLNTQGYSTNTSDVQHTVYKSLCGNGEIIARIASVSGGGWAGITLRESLAQGSKKVGLKTQLTTNIRREIRSTTNGATTLLNFSRPQHTWLRLVRSGSNFTGYTSIDGANWTFAFAATVSMTGCIYAGLFAESINNNVTTTAVFDNVVVTGAVAPLATPDHAVVTAAAPDFEVYPNPSTGEVNVDLKAYANRRVWVHLYDLQGKALKVVEVDAGETTTERLDLSAYENGIYLIRVQSVGVEHVLPLRPDATKRVVLQSKD